jgi:cell fate (sporulation/competence/biofilm development) regulator YlbF (YheA/YmcA/DUF963 family)
MKLQTGNVVKLRGKTGIVLENPYETVNCKLECCYVILDKNGNVIAHMNNEEQLQDVISEFEGEVLEGVALQLT